VIPQSKLDARSLGGHVQREISMSTDIQHLKAEAIYIHQFYFGYDPPEAIVAEYVRAHQCCTFQSLACDARELIIRNRLDLDAIELASRHSQGSLGKKIILLFYLLEAEPQYQYVFVNQDSGRLKAVAALSCTALAMPYRWLKGVWLRWRFHLV